VVKRGFSEKEIAFFMNIDLTNHVALVALAAKMDARSLSAADAASSLNPAGRRSPLL
jgi:hypothetical protein